MNWRRIKKLKNKDSIQKVEEHFGVTFPNDFKEIITHYNGGIVSPSSFDTERLSGKDFGGLLNFNKNDYYNIVDKYNVIKDRLHKGVYPFASDAGGNYLCFDFRDDKNHPTVKFWDHEMKFDIVGDELITEDEYNPNNYHLDFVANTISDLLEALYGEEEEEKKEMDVWLLDYFIDHRREELSDLDADGIDQVNKRMIERGLPPIIDPPKIYKTHKKKNYTKEEWEAFEKDQWDKFKDKP